MNGKNLNNKDAKTQSYGRRNFIPLCLRVFVVPFLFVLSLHAELSKSDLDFFESKIRPIFANKCYKCHSSQAEKLKGGLSLEFRESTLRGGDTGPAIIPGDPEKSLLIKAVRYTDPDLQMPPKGQKLSDTEISDLERWVKMGAPDPRKGDATVQYNGMSKRDHWAFKPVQKSDVPDVKAKDWCKTPLDNFIVAKLEANNMKPAPMADKRTLIRRATFDLIGLPPTQKEVEDFMSDGSPDAFAKVVDRLLASPQYGERWGRHWLDVSRYSDTKGDIRPKFEDVRNPMAWPYRDYVIRSFNEDTPFNKFLVEQIAADRISLSTNQWKLAALGFITLGDHFAGNLNDRINDCIDVVTKGTMGLTVTCARCHDHKFDPISQKDYYALRGVFISCTVPEFGEIIGKPALTPEYMDYAKKFKAIYAQLAEFESQKRKTKEEREREGELRKQLTQLEVTHPAAPARAPVIVDSPKPRNSPVFIRGEAENPGEVVPRRFLEILSGTNAVFRNGSGRLELANAIVHPKNPLTPRVIVNRVWLHHFGAGFVKTPDDFGNQSEPPSHPELLDWLSNWFMENGWSLKKLHREIMLSSVYQQSSENNPRYAVKDPENRLLWRANIRRLEFEAVRDSMLALGGVLDLTMSGKPVNLGQAPYSRRRTIYGYVDRRNLPEIYTQFDFANPDIETGRRYETIVPQQALFLMNSPLVVEQARNLVNREDFKRLRTDESRIKLLYELIYQRKPTPTEVKLGLSFIEDSPEPEKIKVGPLTQASRREEMRKQKRPGRTAMSLASIAPSELKPLGAWEKYAHALLQANEAIFVN